MPEATADRTHTHPELELERERWDYYQDYARTNRQTMAPPSVHHVAKALSTLSATLEQAENQPVIGRVDRTENGEPLSYYIGPAPILTDDESGCPWVASWASPLAEPFYDPERYLSQTESSLDLLRTHIAQDGELIDLVDLLDSRSQEAARPDVGSKEAAQAAETAGKRASERRYRAAQASTRDRTGMQLRSIVTTITPEQHRVIASSSEGHAIITGPAGSGKSSVAFHRLAYLASPDRGPKRLDMRDVLILSPSASYRDYAIPVFQSLGVEAPNFDVLENWSRQCLGPDGAKITVEDTITRQLVRPGVENTLMLTAAVLGGKSRSNARTIRVLDTLIEALWDVDVRGLSHVSVPRTLTGLEQDLEIKLREEIRELRRETHVPLVARRDHLARIAISKTKTASEEASADITLADMRKLLGFRPLPTGLRLLRAWMGTTEPTEVKTINYLELAIARYLHIRAHGPIRTYRHIVVDEAQELTPLDLAALKLHAPEGQITLVGDTCQSISLHRSSTRWKPLIDLLGENTTVVNLNETYRSTIEIAKVAAHLRQKVDASVQAKAASVRGGETPSLHIVNAKHLLISKTVLEAMRLEREVTGQVAVLVRRNNDAKDVKLALRGMDSNATVLRVDAARGREFAGVVIYDASEAAYASNQPINARLLYLAATRALHALVFISLGRPTKLLEGIPRDLLRRDEPQAR